jgi:four helix bundle protein
VLVEDFKQLRVYQRAFQASMTLFQVSKAWPAEERYALTNQIRRSSRAVCANIAEAWFKRRYPNHFASKLSDASSEAAETLIWIDFATACGYLLEDDARHLSEEYRGISGGLVRMMTEANRWCGPSTLREAETDYTSCPSSNVHTSTPPYVHT